MRACCWQNKKSIWVLPEPWRCPTKARAKRAFLFNYHTTWLYSLLSHMVFLHFAYLFMGTVEFFSIQCKNEQLKRTEKEFNCNKNQFYWRFLCFKLNFSFIFRKENPRHWRSFAGSQTSSLENAEVTTIEKFFEASFLFELFIRWNVKCVVSAFALI